MSDNIYDIIDKLNGLGPKDNPVSMSAEPVYESIDPDDIAPAVNSLMGKYEDFLVEEKAKKSQSQKDADVTRGDPELTKLYQKARLERPTAASDDEALAYQVVKANKELAKATAANDEQEQKIADLDAKVTALSTAKPAPVATPSPISAPVAQPTAAAPAAPAARPTAPVLRMPTSTAEPKPTEVPATTAEPVAKPAEVPAPAATKPVGVPTTAQPTVGTDKEEKPTGAEILPFPTRTPAFGFLDKKIVGLKESFNLRIKEAQQQLFPAGNPPTATSPLEDFVDWNNQQLEALADDPNLPSARLIFPNGTINITRYNAERLRRSLLKIKDPIAMKNVAIGVLGNRDTLGRYISDITADKQLHFFYKVKPSEVAKAYNLGLKVNNAGRWYSVDQENPEATKIWGKPNVLAVSPPRGKLAGQQFESLGKTTMKNVEQLAESLMERFANFKEEAKPDFLDLDKDGDTDEPMKKAAKDAKDHEPAKVDKDAVAKRKRLQALKDKQEDERAEKDDYDTKSSSRVVKGRAYGGAAQKDDEEKDLDESGLQAYLGKKKYGKEGMKALQKAGREGVSKEKMALIRAKHDKMDEAQMDEVSYSAKAARAGKDIGKPGKAFAKIAKSAGERYGSKERGEKVAGAVLKKLRANEGEGCMDEVAPPGAKAERMVKHIKKGYAKDGKLSKKEKGIAYATAWKAHNKGQVEEGTEFGDTIKNSEAKMTKVKVTEGKEAIRNHPIYTNEEAWNHYKQELDEQEAMEADCMEAPVVDIQEELNEIARLAGLAPKMEAKGVCPSCKCEQCECNETLDPMVPGDSASPLTHTEEGMGCSMEELKEAMSRKHYREMADKIKNMENRDDAEKICRTFVEMAKADNPRFKEDMFLAACGIKSPAAVLVDEEAMDEGNEFTKARLDAIAAGKDSFTIGGKTYKVSGDTSQEKTQVESIDDEKQAVKEDININVSANGEEDVVNLIRKLSGMPVVAIQAPSMAEETMEEQAVEEERDIELANTPHEKIAPITAVTTDAGGGLGGVKKQYPLAANRGANPIEEQVEESLWKAYETMINDLKA